MESSAFDEAAPGPSKGTVGVADSKGKGKAAISVQRSGGGPSRFKADDVIGKQTDKISRHTIKNAAGTSAAGPSALPPQPRRTGLRTRPAAATSGTGAASASQYQSADTGLSNAPDPAGCMQQPRHVLVPAVWVVRCHPAAQTAGERGHPLRALTWIRDGRHRAMKSLVKLIKVDGRAYQLEGLRGWLTEGRRIKVDLWCDRYLRVEVLSSPPAEGGPSDGGVCKPPESVVRMLLYDPAAPRASKQPQPSDVSYEQITAELQAYLPLEPAWDAAAAAARAADVAGGVGAAGALQAPCVSTSGDTNGNCRTRPSAPTDALGKPVPELIRRRRPPQKGTRVRGRLTAEGYMYTVQWKGEEKLTEMSHTALLGHSKQAAAMVTAFNRLFPLDQREVTDGEYSRPPRPAKRARKQRQ